MQRLTKALKERARKEIKEHPLDYWESGVRFKYRGEEFLVDYSWDSPGMLQLYETFEDTVFTERFGAPFPIEEDE